MASIIITNEIVSKMTLMSLPTALTLVSLMPAALVALVAGAPGASGALVAGATGATGAAAAIDETSAGTILPIPSKVRSVYSDFQLVKSNFLNSYCIFSQASLF